MSDKETFGVELELITNKFKTKMQELINFAKKSSANIQQNSKANIDVETELSVVKIARLEQTISNLKSEALNVDVNSKAFEEYAVAIDEAEQELKDLKQELKNTNSEINNFGKTINSNFNSAIKKSKKFILSLFSLRSAWALISRASNIYLQNNEEINKKTQITANIFGNILGPVVKKVIDYTQYGAIALAKLVYLFTGYNALANITAKNLNKVSSAAKTMNKNLGGLDEITNLEGNSDNTLSNNILSSVNAMKDFEEKVKEVDDIFNKYESKIKTGTKLLLAMFGAKTVANIAGVIGSAGSGTGLAGVASLLGTIGMGAVAVVSVTYAVKSYKELNEEIEKTEQIYKDLKTQKELNIEIEKNIQDEIKKKLKLNQINNGDLETHINQLKQKINWDNEEIECWQTKIDKMGTFEKLFTRNYPKYREEIQLTIEKNQVSIDTIYEVVKALGYDNDKLKEVGFSTEGLIEIMNNQLANLENLNSSYSESTDEYQENADKIANLKVQINSLTRESYQAEIEKIEKKNEKLKVGSKEYESNCNQIQKLKEKINALPKDKNIKVNVKAEADTKKAEKDYGNFFSRLGESVGALGGLFTGGGISGVFKKIKSIWSFDVGTNYVPNDSLAVVHKGEQIIPAKWNPATSGIYNSNSEVISKLDELIETLENKDMNTYLDGNKIGQSTVNYINNQNRIKGRSVI